jgi:hypothetical protein
LEAGSKSALEALVAQNGAVGGGSGRSQWRLKVDPGGSVDQWLQIRITLIRSRIRICVKVKSRIRIRIKVMRDPQPPDTTAPIWSSLLRREFCM